VETPLSSSLGDRRSERAEDHLRSDSKACLTTFSVAHSFEQDDDLIADPEIDLLRDGSGAWCPVSITTEHAVMFVSGGKARVDERGYRSQHRLRTTENPRFRSRQAPAPSATAKITVARRRLPVVSCTGSCG
jgi:hypothetical protein